MASPTYADQVILAADTLFIGRVTQCLILQCSNIRTEATPAAPANIPQPVIDAFYKARGAFATVVMANPVAYGALFAKAAAANGTVIANVTSGGTLVGMSGAQVDTAQALAADTDLNNAVSAAFNTFFNPV